MVNVRKTAVEIQFDKDSQGYLLKHLTKEKIREKDRILNLIQQKKIQNILDIGCGPGTISEYLLGFSENVWGIDISEEMIKVASKRYESTSYNTRTHFVKGDAENLKFPDQFFDVVICLGVLRYLDSWEKSLQEIYRVLKPNGTVIITFYSRFSPYWFSLVFLYRPLLPLISILKRRTFKELILKYKAEPLPFSYSKFKNEFAKIGFKHSVTQHSGFEIWPFNLWFPNLSSQINLRSESALYDSNKLGWLGSICIVKGLK